MSSFRLTRCLLRAWRGLGLRVEGVWELEGSLLGVILFVAVAPVLDSSTPPPEIPPRMIPQTTRPHPPTTLPKPGGASWPSLLASWPHISRVELAHGDGHGRVSTIG